MPAGRPTKYDPKMCDTVIECGKEGMGRCEIAMKLGIHFSTLQDWEENIKEFSEALKESRRLSQAVWEEHNRKVAFGKADTNAAIMIFNMKNRFPDDWKDKREEERTGSVTNIIVGSTDDAKALSKLDESE